MGSSASCNAHAILTLVASSEERLITVEDRRSLPYLNAVIAVKVAKKLRAYLAALVIGRPTQSEHLLAKRAYKPIK